MRQKHWEEEKIPRRRNTSEKKSDETEFDNSTL